MVESRGAEDLECRIRFLTEADKLKGVMRRSPLMDGSRFENSAEHSWHVSLAALALADYATEGVDISHVIQMLLVHDLVEIDAGDTFAYDATRRADQAERETIAAERVFSLLPANQAAAYMALFREFDARQTAESRFANAVDRLLPLLHNFIAKGGSWQAHGVRRSQVLERMRPIESGAPALWPFACALIDEAVDKGYMLP